MRYPETLTVPITLDRTAAVALHHQIAGQLVAAVRAGSLAPGTRMPSTRTLAVLLGVSRGVAAAAYDELVARGVAAGREGSGTYVTGQRRGTTATRGGGARPAGVDFTPGRASGEIFPLAAWRAAWRQASCRMPGLEAPPALGLPQLRAAIAEHLVRTRGLAPAGHEVVVTTGLVPGLRLVLEALGAEPLPLGATPLFRGAGPPAPVAVETPAVPAWWDAVTGAGRIPVALGVDGDGARVTEVPRGCRAAVLTSEGHLGWGRTLSARRRADVAGWAVENDGTVVELACDAVFRPAANRLPRLLDLAGEHAVLVGGFCEALTPALGLGYAVLPRPLAAAVGRLVAQRAEHPPYLTQLAVARLLADGTITRLMHRRGQLHAHKRTVVQAALAATPGIALDGLDTVGSVALRLPGGTGAAEVARRLLTRGVQVGLLGDGALLLGYGHLPDDELHRGLAALVAALPGCLDGPRPVAA